MSAFSISRYETPDPDGWYFGQRRLGIEIRDLYGQLIDGTTGALGRVRSGGDQGGMAMQGGPPVRKLVAFFSGPVRVDRQGKATVSVAIPDFNGSVRVMATAWSGRGFGHAESRGGGARPDRDHRRRGAVSRPGRSLGGATRAGQ